MSRIVLVTALALCVAAPARAQEGEELPPGHPTVAAPESEEMPPGHPPVAAPEGEELPPGHPPAAAEPPGHAPHPAGGGGHPDMRTLFDPPPIASAAPSSDVPAGTIRVRVADPDGSPAAGAEVQLGIMRQGEGRSRVPMRTGADGIAVFRDLATGTDQAYRVNVVHEGATYSTTPFRLEGEEGYEARIVRLPTTHDDRALFMMIGQTVVELRDERLHITQHVQLGNPTMSTYVFPDAGLPIRLPEGFLVFQAQAVMTDQRVEEVSGRGLRIRGSLPPGTVTLAWAYELPVSGEDMDLSIQVPLTAIRYRVITDAPPGLRVEVDGMERMQSFEDEGRPMFGTELVRRPGDPALDEVRIHLRGIPGPGPERTIALAVMLAFVLAGIAALSMTPAKDAGQRAAAAREGRRRELLDEAAELEREHEAGEVGPEFRQSRRRAIVEELAALLRADELAASRSPGASKKSGRSGERRSA